jgi:hypothetical protein
MSAVPPVDCCLRSSRVHVLLLLAIHLPAGVALLHTRLPIAFAAVLALGLLAGAAREVWRGALRAGPGAVRRVRADAAGWWLHRADGGIWGPAWPTAARTWPRALTLELRDAQGARHRLQVFQDATSGDQLRRLRARARRELGGSGR